MTTTGTLYRHRITFTDRRVRHIRVVTIAGGAGLTIGPNDAVGHAPSRSYRKRVDFLGAPGPSAP